MKYITYKIINTILLFFFRAKYVSNIGNTQLQKYFFDFSHHSVHLGDRFFYFPAILQLISEGADIYIDKNDKTTQVLFEFIFNIKLDYIKNYKDPNIIYVTSAHSFSGKFRRFFDFKNRVLIEFDQMSQDDVIKQINKQLNLFQDFDWRKSIKKNILEFNCPVFNKINMNEKVVLFSNYINSGFFRRFFINENKLIDKVRQLKTEGCCVVHVGSKHDILSDKRKYDFVDVDLRGSTTTSEMVALISQHKKLVAVTYDNFIMHLCHMYGQSTFVLFRGRFTKRSFEFHMRCVNETLITEGHRPIYL